MEVRGSMYIMHEGSDPLVAHSSAEEEEYMRRLWFINFQFINLLKRHDHYTTLMHGARRGHWTHLVVAVGEYLLVGTLVPTALLDDTPRRVDRQIY